MAEEEEADYPQQPTHPMPGDDDDDDDDEDSEDSKDAQDTETKTGDDTTSSSLISENKKCGFRTCSILAHNKMIFHALKHLNRSIFGLLIGITYRDTDSSSNHSYIHIMDVIPLQHNIFSSMVVEVAFLQIEEYLNSVSKATNISRKNVRILGVYYANGHSDDVSKNTSAIIITSQLIKEYSRNSVLLCQVIADRLDFAYKGNDSAIDCYMLRNNGDSENKKDWKDIDDLYLVKTNRLNIKNDDISYQNWLINMNQLQLLDIENKKFNQLNLKHLLKNKMEDKLYDFEDHLDDQSKDWRNLQLFNQ